MLKKKKVPNFFMDNIEISADDFDKEISDEDNSNEEN